MSNNGFVERFDLGDGQWADISTERLHRTVTAVLNVFIRYGRAVSAGLPIPDDDAEIILAMVTGWHVVHNGETLELSPDGIANAPEDLVSKLIDRCMEIHNQKPEADPVVGSDGKGPLGEAAPSPASKQATG